VTVDAPETVISRAATPGKFAEVGTVTYMLPQPSA
jgi:hypothetical protein